MFRIIFVIVITTCLNAHASSDTLPVSLQKEITNVAGENFNIKELTLPGAVSSQLLTGRFHVVSTPKVPQSFMYVYLGKVNTCRAGGCSIKREQPIDSASEYFEYFILFDSTGSIMKVKIYNYQATHGHEITSKNWLKQYKNYNGVEKLTAGKNIDAISGATISVEAINFDIEHKTNLLKQIISAK